MIEMHSALTFTLSLLIISQYNITKNCCCLLVVVRFIYLLILLNYYNIIIIIITIGPN